MSSFELTNNNPADVPEYFLNFIYELLSSNKLPPEICNLSPGVVVPIPTFPFAPIVNNLEFVEEETAKISADPAVPVICNFAEGVEVPIPVFPFAATVKSGLLFESVMLNRFATCPATPLIARTVSFTVLEIAEMTVFRNGVVVPNDEEPVPFT